MTPRIRILGFLLPLLLTDCVAMSQGDVDHSSPPFDPIAFFTGPTRGTGVLTMAFRHRERVLVEGHGRMEGDDTIVLDQTVQRGTRPSTHRRWRLTRVAAGRYVGTLTDAAGQVAGDVVGNRLHLAFRTKGRLAVEQWLVPAPGGKEAHNIVVVSRLGLPVARLDETIAREPGPAIDGEADR